MTFGEKLFKLRSDAGFSQDKLAEMLEVSCQSVSKWERDEAMPDTDKIVIISRIFSVSTDSLLKDESELQAYGKGAEDGIKNEIPQLNSENDVFEMAEEKDKIKKFERGSLMDFFDEMFKVVKRYLSLLGLFVIMSQISSFFYSFFNAAYVIGYKENFDTSLWEVFYSSLNMGSIGAMLGILTGIVLVIYGIHLRKNGGADNE